MSVREPLENVDDEAGDGSGQSKGIWGCALYTGITLALLALAAVFVVEAEWVGDNVVPWLELVCLTLVGVNIVVLGPMALAKRSRDWAGFWFFVSSYAFGVTAWLLGTMLTWHVWGGWAAVAGLLAIVGCVPMALAATVIEGMWPEFGVLTLAIVLTFGLRRLGKHLAETDWKEPRPPKGKDAKADRLG